MTDEVQDFRGWVQSSPLRTPVVQEDRFELPPSARPKMNNETIDLADGRSVPAAAVAALDELERAWPGATLPQARPAIVAAVSYYDSRAIDRVVQILRENADVNHPLSIHLLQILGVEPYASWPTDTDAEL